MTGSSAPSPAFWSPTARYRSAQLAGPPTALALAHRLGIGTAVTLGLVDLVYGATGRISRVYLLDALVEAGWIAAWSSARR